MLVTLVTAAHLFICIVLMAVVLLQHGKGADAGATFGGGSQTMFGASGADNLLTRVTTALAALFMLTSIFLAYNARNKPVDQGGLFKDGQSQAAPAQEVPAAEQAPEQTSPAPAATDNAKPEKTE